MNVCKLSFLALGLAAVLSTSASALAAEGLATPGDRTDVSPRSHNTRLVTFAYDPNVAFSIRSRVGVFTNVEVPEGESVTGFYISDETAWQWHVASDKKRVLIRPNAPNELNTATLVTNLRTYELTLESFVPGELWHQRVRWAVASPDGAPAGAGRWSAFDASESAPIGAGALMLMDVANLNLSYSVEARRKAEHLAPSAVFDDGVRTYFQFPPRGDVPAIFATDKRAKRMEIVEFAVQGPYLVVPHTSAHWLLVLGDDRVLVNRR